MPEPGSHAYDIQRARLRKEIDGSGTPDKNATIAANRQLQGEDEPVDVAPGQTLDADGNLEPPRS